ncbi:hypothetical protein LOTGIDRAFT_235309 [Lottia gigantea]|uniref:Chitin-binding type-2 domain-containing protein n=1 Tax=Lottia gigantea TaxID=225164 RepID=V3ZQT7_LOTGI|nr:hypothetical protein LOTGIDRAFT_235309 [Lottia gigantea]ESO86722.1 hypothetical protein LOTGIDRAFT_235309 [Lottia gigantea]
MYLRRFDHQTLIAQAVLLLTGFTLAKNPEYPCPDAIAIQWVRDPRDCTKYFICHFGKPLTMPGCPLGQVWGNMARNCVPEGSRWDDCTFTKEKPPSPGWVPKAKHPNSIDGTFLAAPIFTKTTRTETIPTTIATDLKYQKTVIIPKSTKRNQTNNRLSKSPFVRFTTTTMVNLKVKLTGLPEKVRDEKPVYQITTRMKNINPYHTTQRTVEIPGDDLATIPDTTTSKSIQINHQVSDEKKLFEKGSPCYGLEDRLLPHTYNCHWYYNCSLSNTEEPIYGEPYVRECRYPQLFDIETSMCREFINVRCGDRFEAVDRCEYDINQCRTSDCVPCEFVHGTCRGKENGIYPLHSDRWSPTFVTCYSQRSIAQDDCQDPNPIFSTDVYDCVSIYEVPKPYGGLRPECSYRPDGFYPDEQSRCGMFFECKNREFLSYDKCPSGLVFDPLTLKCESTELSIAPCGSGIKPICIDRMDGYHADPYGRCSFYFECRKRKFIKYHTCDYGSFDPVTSECVLATELLPRPCGLLTNPCEGKDSGFYTDSTDGCRKYFECGRGVLIRNDTCPHGSVFNEKIGRCDKKENVPAPCGEAPTCHHKTDGKYAAISKGCSFYYECRKNEFLGFKQCSFSDGGFFFNNITNTCDYPQNICPPCGYRWWGW